MTLPSLVVCCLVRVHLCTCFIRSWCAVALVCAAVYSISRPEQGRTGLSLAALAAVRKMSHSLRVKATEPREPGRPDTACLIFTPPSRESRSPTQRERKRDRKWWHAAWTGCSVNLPLGWRNRFSRTKRRISCTSCTKCNLIMSNQPRCVCFFSWGKIEESRGFLFWALKESDRYLGLDWVVAL